MYAMRARAMALAALTALTACGDSTGPRTGDFDAQAAQADHEALDRLLSSEGWTAFRALGGQGPFAALGGQPAAITGSLRALTPGATGAERAAALQWLAAGMRSWSRSPIISEERRGTTFVYDAERRDYVPDPSRTGAPANGVRFIVYEEIDGQPDPTREVGYADLLDEGDASAEDIVLRLVCVRNGLEVLNYRTSLDDIGEDAGVITVDGYLQDAEARLDFDIDVVGADGVVDLDFRIAMDAREFEILGDVTGSEEENGPGAVDLSVRHGDESLAIAIQSDGATVSGVVHVNGELFANAGGDAQDPTFTGADGEALTLTEIGVLIQVFGVAEDVFNLTGGLLAPVAGLVAVGILL